MKLWMKVTMLALCCASMVFTACKDANEGYSLVAGTLDGPLVSSSAPPSVHEAMKRAERYHNYEIMSDSANAVCVEAIAEVGDISTEGYGIVVVKGDISTTFPDICNARNPMARYDEQSNTLWLTSSAVWGTGIQVDWLYQIGFGDNGIAYIVHTVDPYDIQQQLCQRLGYRIKGEQITLYDGEREIAQATNTDVLRRIISIYSASVTSRRRSKFMSYCCPSPISKAVSVKRAITAASLSGRHWAIRS